MDMAHDEVGRQRRVKSSPIPERTSRPAWLLGFDLMPLSLPAPSLANIGTLSALTHAAMSGFEWLYGLSERGTMDPAGLHVSMTAYYVT